MFSNVLQTIKQLLLLLCGDIERNPGPESVRLEERPTILKLQCFQFTANRRQKRINIIETTASRWRELGTALKLDCHQLDNIKSDNPHCVKDRCRVVLKTWLNNSDDLTWRTLLLAMRDAGSTSVAQQVWRALTDGEDMPILPAASSPLRRTNGKLMFLFTALSFLVLAILVAFTYLPSTLPGPSAATSRHLPLPDSLMQYQKYLQDYYSDKEYPDCSKLVSSMTNRPEQPVNLVLIQKEDNENDASFVRHQELLSNGSVNEIQKQKASVHANEIGTLNDGKTAHFVLIEGGPGMGKSTLCWQLCRLWREGKLQWDLMVIVELRDESTRRANNLYDLFQYYPDDKIRQAIAQDIQKREGEGLLIFLDGYDELSNQQQNELSVIQQILMNKQLRKATVVVTSRPYATKDILDLFPQFKQNLDQHIGIIGFNSTYIHTYITSACKNNQSLLENLRFYVDTHPFVLSVMYNPLHCFFVTKLYIEYWQNEPQFAPNTLTELYEAVLLNLLKRHLHQNSDIHDLADLPKNVYTNLMQLAELAARGLKERQYIFTNLSCDSHLGLMDSVRKLYDIRKEQPIVHTFLHLTLQEYLAALYWSIYHDKQPTEFLDSEIKNCMTLKMPNSEEHRPFCSFYAGLTKIKIDIEQTKTIDKFYIPQMCELLFEARSSDILFDGSIIKLPGNTDGYSDQFVNDLIEAPLASFTMAYCFVQNSDSTTTWFLRIKEKKHLQRLVEGMHSANRGKTWNETNMPSLRLHFTRDVNDILEVLPDLYPFTKSITQLNLSGDLNDKGVDIMKNLSHICPRLTSLLITRNSSQPSMTERFDLPPKVDLTSVELYLPYDEELLNNLNQYQAVTTLNIRPERTCKCELVKICDSLKNILPKLHGGLPSIFLFTQDVKISDQCVVDIARSLSGKSVVLYTIKKQYYRFKNLHFYDTFDPILASAFLQVHQKNPIHHRKRVLISGSIDCDAAKTLIQAMKTMRSVIAERLVLHLNKRCKRVLANINYSKNTVKLIFL